MRSVLIRIAHRIGPWAGCAGPEDPDPGRICSGQRSDRVRHTCRRSSIARPYSPSFNIDGVALFTDPVPNCDTCGISIYSTLIFPAPRTSSREVFQNFTLIANQTDCNVGCARRDNLGDVQGWYVIRNPMEGSSPDTLGPLILSFVLYFDFFFRTTIQIPFQVARPTPFGGEFFNGTIPILPESSWNRLWRYCRASIARE